MAKYQKYAEYKDTGVEWLGEIPSHWEMWKLSHAYNEIGSGTTPSTSNEENFEGDIPWVTTGELRENIILDTKKKVSQKTIELFPTLRKYPSGSVAIAMYGATIGRLGILGVEATTNQACCVMTTSKVLDNKYLFYWLQAFKNEIIQLSSGGGQPNINQEKVASLKISAPLVEDQVTIVNFLDHETAKIDSLIAKQEKLIELLKEKRQAVISHAVTKGLNSNVPMKDSGVEWLGQVPEHWIVSKLKYESEVVDCRNKTPEYFENGEYFVIRTTNVKNQKLNFNGALYTDKKNFEIWTQRGVPPAGSILFTREAPTGEVCLVPENIKFCMGQRMMNFIANTKSYSDYLFDYLISDCLERYINSVSHGSTVTHLRVEQVENIPVLVPSDAEIKEIHHHILIIKNKYDAIENKAHQTIQLMQERRTALISAAVTGKIDVQNWQNPTEAKMEFSA